MTNPIDDLLALFQERTYAKGLVPTFRIDFSKTPVPRAISANSLASAVPGYLLRWELGGQYHTAVLQTTGTWVMDNAVAELAFEELDHEEMADYLNSLPREVVIEVIKNTDQFMTVEESFHAICAANDVDYSELSGPESLLSPDVDDDAVDDNLLGAMLMTVAHALRNEVVRDEDDDFDPTGGPKPEYLGIDVDEDPCQVHSLKPFSPLMPDVPASVLRDSAPGMEVHWLGGPKGYRVRKVTETYWKVIGYDRASLDHDPSFVWYYFDRFIQDQGPAEFDSRGFINNAQLARILRRTDVTQADLIVPA